MRKQLLYVIILLIPYLSTQSKENQYIKKLNITQPIQIHKPILIDSLDLNNEKFEDLNLLKTISRLPLYEEYGDMIDSFEKDFLLEPANHDFCIQFLSFNISADRYTDIDMTVKSSNIYEVYIDKKKVAENNTHIEGSKMPEAKTNIVLLPNELKTITLKILRNQKLDKEQINIAISSDTNDHIQFSYNNKRRTKIEDALWGKRISSISTSPQGDYLLIKLNEVNQKGEKNNILQLIDIKQKKTITLDKEDYSWLPSSNLLYRLNKNSENQYDLITLNPVSLQQTILANNIPNNTNTKFLPNEQYLILQEYKNYDKRKGDIKPILSPEDRQDGYLSRSLLYLYNLKQGIQELLFFGKPTVQVEDISLDSKHLLLSTTKETVTQRPFRVKTFFILDLDTRKTDTLLLEKPFIQSGKFSPDNKKIIFTGSAEAFDGIGLNISEEQTANSYNTLAFIYNLDTKKVDPFTKNFNPSIKQILWKSPNLIFLSTVEKTYETVYSFDLSTKKFSKLHLDGDVITFFDSNNSGNEINYIAKSIKSPTEIYNYNTKTNKNTLILSPMKNTMDNLILGEVKNWEYELTDGTKIDGFYHLPPNFDPSKKYPMLVYYYGGTMPTSKTFEHPYSMHYFASLGYVVYTIIPSGSIGYGQEFAARHVNAWGKQTGEDIIGATKNFTKNHAFVDSTRIGCLGASYGGFMTMYLLTQTNIFKTAIAHAGISSISSYWGEGYWGYTYSSAASANSYPWNNKDLYVNQSPLFNADKINTPLLLTHGMVDTNVPIGESIQLFTALKILGKPVEFLQIKDENHGISNFNRKIDWTHSMGAWFDKWLKDQPKWWNNLYPETK